MSVTVRVPTTLRTLTGGASEVALEGATVGEVLDVAMGVTRWGNTSFVLGVEVTVGARAVLTGELTYVGVTPGTTETIPPPPEIKAKLSERV